MLRPPLPTTKTFRTSGFSSLGRTLALIRRASSEGEFNVGSEELYEPTAGAATAYPRANCRVIRAAGLGIREAEGSLMARVIGARIMAAQPWIYASKEYG